MSRANESTHEGTANVVGLASTGSQIAVIAKAGLVLDALLEHPGGATPSDIAASLGINRSTAFRLLTSLESAGLLDREQETGQYRLGLKLLMLGDAVRDRMDLIKIAEPIMRRLRDEQRQSVYLAGRDGWGAVCLHRLPGPDVDVLAWKAGQWLPFHSGAGPRALLAALPDDELDQYLEIPQERRTRRGLLSDNQIWEMVRETRKRGWSLNLEDLTEGVSSLGVVVRAGTGAPLCVISVAGLTPSYRGARLESLSSAVVKGADELFARIAIGR